MIRNQYQPKERGRKSLITARKEEVALGTGTAVLTARDDAFFLVKKVIAANTTGGAVDVSILVNGNTWSQQSIAANSTAEIETFSGMLLDPSDAVTATGSGVRLILWGVTAQGGVDWL